MQRHPQLENTTKSLDSEKSKKETLLEKFCSLYSASSYSKDAKAELYALIQGNEASLDDDKNNVLHYLVSATNNVSYHFVNDFDKKIIKDFRHLLLKQNQKGITPLQLAYLKTKVNVNSYFKVNVSLLYSMWVQISKIDDIYAIKDQHEHSSHVLKALFMRAIEDKQSKLISQFLKLQLLNLSNEPNWEYTILTKVIRRNNLMLLEMLLKEGFSANASHSNYKSTILIKSLQAGPVFVRCLLRYGADPNTPGSTSLRPLHEVKSIEALKILLDAGADIEGKVVDTKLEAWKSHVGNTPLAEAVRKGRNNIAETLIVCGAKTEKIDNDGNDLIHMAVKYRNPGMLRYAINKLNQSIYQNNKLNQSAVDILIANNQGSQDLTIIEIIFSQDEFDKDKKDQFGNTLLMQYLKHNNLLRKVEEKYLIEKLFDQINIANDSKNTPLHIVAKKGFLALFSRLLKLGANINAVNNNNITPLLILLNNSLVQIKQYKLLTWLKQVLNPNLVNEDGLSLLHLCAQKGFGQCVKLLVSKGADAGLLDKFGFNSAFYALAYGVIDTYFYLKNLGYDITIEMLTAKEEDDKPSSFKRLQKAALSKYNIINAESEEYQQQAIIICMNAILFTRWSDTSDYAKYKTCITHLINRYGKNSFVNALTKLFLEHLHSLDLENTEDLDVDGNKTGPHSDMNPYPEEYMSVAKYLLNDQYPLHPNMSAFGYLVNVKTIFGDKDFWEICKENHPTVFNTLIKAVEQWPKESKSIAPYHKVDSFSPIKVFHDNFTEAFDFIKPNLSEGVLDRVSKTETTSSLFHPRPTSSDQNAQELPEMLLALPKLIKQKHSISCKIQRRDFSKGYELVFLDKKTAEEFEKKYQLYGFNIGRRFELFTNKIHKFQKFISSEESLSGTSSESEKNQLSQSSDSSDGPPPLEDADETLFRPI